MKVKCSGSQPCTRCDRKHVTCQFPATDKRVSVPESYLRALEGRQDGSASDPFLENETWSSRQLRSRDSNVGARAVGAGEGSMTSGRGEMVDPVLTPGTSQEHQSEHAHAGSVIESALSRVEPAFQQNPLVDNDYTFAFAQENGKYWYMGPSSSWAFCRRVLSLVGKHLPDAGCEPAPWHLDGVAFKMQRRPLGFDEAPDVSNLPPSDYALFLVKTATFYLGPLANIIDEQSFLRNMKELYQDAPTKAKRCRHWYAQFLLMLAFGKAFLGNGGKSDKPPGYNYAARAMSLLPDLAAIDNDPVVAAQALTLAAIYFQSVDMRVPAFQHIGQALRICVLAGMHRHMREDVVGVELSRRCHIVFWIVYMLDLDWAALIGATSSIRDEDITTKLPSETDDSLNALTMTLHVRLSRLTTRVLTTVYGVGKNYDGTLITDTQSILRNLAELSRDLNALISTYFQDSISKASRTATRLILGYHHCVVLTTRPQIMCALHMHIEQATTQVSRGINLSPPVASLIQSCVDSAQTVLSTLRALADEDLLESFLPFQVEYASSSAFLLHLITVICPYLLHDHTWREDINYILDTMISKGSLVAPLRKVELSQLEQKLSSFTPASEVPETQEPSTVEDELQHQVQGELEHEDHAIIDETGWDHFAANAMAGLSPRELLDLAEQLDVDCLLYPPEM
ncbi:hypothetical protein BGZ61DRAFT_527804 [Ilyonectria robusta]|uniref:uncharacterized protein n=1 Tax=Ilyonectria robusta TaxID=1079257 RepID=UPI001E8CA589|nr:uncharacterized protein BGZ61DRAFT_527804 [Ilyonectria robusta]KAH8734461.1 hypothetical protein BGZ61DRAFT_527804 [Ilyonectria robusta]